MEIIEALRAVFALWVILFISSVSTQMVVPFLGIYALSIGATPILVGYIYATQNATSIVSRIPGAGLSDRYGRKKLMIIGLAFNTLGLATYIISSNPSLMFLGRVFQGLGFAISMPSMLSYMISRSWGRLRPEEGVAYTMTSVPLGHALGPAIASTILPALGFHGLFVMSTIAGGIAVFMAILLLREDGSQYHPSEMIHAERGVGRIKQIMRVEFILLLVSRGGMSYVIGTVTAFLPLFVVGKLGLSEAYVGVLFTAAALFSVAARPVSAQIALRRSERTSLTLACILATIGSILVIVSESSNLILLAVVIYGSGWGLFVPSSISYTGKILPEEGRTIGMAILTIILDLGSTVGGVASGLILGSGSFVPVFLAAATAGSCGALAMLISGKLSVKKK